jgi:hypothetical protein
MPTSEIGRGDYGGGRGDRDYRGGYDRDARRDSYRGDRESGRDHRVSSSNYRGGEHREGDGEDFLKNHTLTEGKPILSQKENDTLTEIKLYSHGNKAILSRK